LSELHREPSGSDILPESLPEEQFDIGLVIHD